MCPLLYLLCPHKPKRQTHHTLFTNQQTIGGVDGEAAGEGVVYWQSIHIGGLPVASPLVNVPTHVEVDGVAAILTLLAHVLQFHVGQVHGWKVTKDLQRGGVEEKSKLVGNCKIDKTNQPGCGDTRLQLHH